MTVAVAMLGARMHYAVPRLLYEAGLLEKFFTDSYIGNKPLLEKTLRAMPSSIAQKGISRWLGRKDPVLPANMVTSFDFTGIWYALARARSTNTATSEKLAVLMAKRFASAIQQKGFGEAKVIWGFNTESAEMFANAHTMNKLCILEQTMLPRVLSAKLLAREAADWRGWQPSLHLPDYESLQARRERQEWALADHIVAGSTFVTEGLASCGVPTEKLNVIPYGVDPARFPPPVRRAPVSTGPLRVLFVGEVGLRKGAPYLLEALAELGPKRVTARLAGRVMLKPDKLVQYGDVAEFLGAVPRTSMTELFQWAQVFVLPSLVEGSATASYEALLSGLPVIATPNTGTIVQDGCEGRIVPIRDSTAIAEALRAYYEDSSLLESHADAAVMTRYRAGLERYGRDLQEFIGKVIDK